QQLQIPTDDLQHIVEIMGYTASKLADGFQPVRLRRGRLGCGSALLAMRRFMRVFEPRDTLDALQDALDLSARAWYRCMRQPQATVLTGNRQTIGYTQVENSRYRRQAVFDRGLRQLQINGKYIFDAPSGQALNITHSPLQIRGIGICHQPVMTQQQIGAGGNPEQRL